MRSNAGHGWCGVRAIAEMARILLQFVIEENLA
jgi:hypothetical protein